MDNLNLVLKREEKENTVIRVGDVEIGKDFLVIAGPCSIETEDQIIETAQYVKKSGANMLRGGAYKPRTSPYSFQGLGRLGLEYLKEAGTISGLPTITEVTDTRDVYLISDYVDVLQIGARNMQNFNLLVEVGKCNKPVLLKRGMNATIEEWLNAAEYIMNEGNPNVILCERGIRTIETYTRNTFDVSAISVIKQLTHLPIIADPSHATGHADLIEPMTLSAIMAGADGLEIEVHPRPFEALSDAQQQLTPGNFELLMRKIHKTVEFRHEIEE